MSPDQRVHPAAAEGFERAAEEYERGRPDFPQDAVDLLIERLGLSAGRTLVELGAGTGKLTRLLAPSGVRIVAVEPVAAMRAALARSVPAAEILDAVAEELPLDDGTIDGAVAAQAFHWFDGPRVLNELGRVLTPNGRLALIWNVRDESVPWIRELTDLIEPYRRGTPSHRASAWKEAFEATDAFPPPTLTSFPYLHETTREGTVARIVSISFIAALPDDERRQVADGVRRVVPGDEVAFAYRTDVWITERRA
jgi:ubiquinone/menaquinone biosynthesis C-methylase UbiE